jgi:DeoR family transcriptional regulator of aga operon
MRDNEDAAMNRAFIAAANRVTVMADHTKLASFASFRVCPWLQVHRLITDAGADPQDLNIIRQQGVDIVISG